MCLSVCQSDCLSICLCLPICLSAQPCSLSGVVRKAFTKGYRSSLAVGALLVHDKCTRSVCICARVHACVRKWRKEYAHVIQSKGGRLVTILSETTA